MAHFQDWYDYFFLNFNKWQKDTKRNLLLAGAHVNSPFSLKTHFHTLPRVISAIRAEDKRDSYLTVAYPQCNRSETNEIARSR